MQLREILGGAFALVAFGSSYVIVQRTRRQSSALALPMALAALVVHEAALLPLLSVFRWVTPVGVAVGHLPLLTLGVVLALRPPVSGRPVRARLLHVTGASWTLALLPALLLGLSSAIAYPPNSWDAMTYHLARVAHWITNESVFAYWSWQPRQNTFPPGAGYLALLPQIVADSDRFAPFLQLGCWLLVALATPSWARLLGAPRKVAAAAGVVVAAAPMAVLQASSTQHDLVAAVIALALASASLRLRNPARADLRDGALFGTALAAAWLVKSTALIAAAPFVVWALASWVRGVPRAAIRSRALPAVAAAVGISGSALALELFRRRTVGLDFDFDLSLYAYPLLGQWGERAANVVRSLAHHFPIAGILTRLSTAFAPLTGPGLGTGPEPFRASEDLAGNPIQASLFIITAILMVAAAVRGRSRRSLWIALACPFAAWVLLHLLARDNTWISRLELPVFVLGASSLAALGAASAAWRARAPWIAFAIAVPCVIHGTFIASRNELRPPTVSALNTLDARYQALPQFRTLDDAALRIAATRGCTRIGSRLAPPDWLPDPWDYPLVWRAHLAGRAVQHVTGPEAWPCVLYTLTEPPQPRWGSPWVWSGDELVFVRSN